MTPSEPLGPAMVLQGVTDALPTHAEGDTTSHLSSSLDCVAIFVHACLVNLGFRLLGFHEDKNIGVFYYDTFLDTGIDPPLSIIYQVTLTAVCNPRITMRQSRAPSAVGMEQLAQLPRFRLRT